MTAPVNDSAFEKYATTLRHQTIAAFFALGLKKMKIVPPNPLAFGVGMQTTMKILILSFRLLPEKPNLIMKLGVTGSLLLPSYKLASTLDPRLQLICFVAFMLFDINKIGPQNILKALKG